MSPWQVLHAGRTAQAAVGHHVHRGAGALAHYSTAAAAAPDSSRSFCLSREISTMQQLNSRLASYLQQVKHLEAANQKLESLIQQELDRKCPRELRELDAHLRTVSLLQDQISERLSAQAQVKLQLLSAELTIFDFNIRYEKEHERCGCLEEELSNLKLVEEELQVTTLPDLQNLLNSQTKELRELQTQHQQDMQYLLARMSGGVNVEMLPSKSLDLIQQLHDLRQTNVTLLDKNQNEHWFNTQVSMFSSPEVNFGHPAGSEVIQSELEELKRTAAILEEELAHLQTLNVELEASGLEQHTSFVQKLVVLQDRTDSLCADLDSVLQAAAQQAADHQSLLDVKTRLETEIQDYRRLLDRLSPQSPSYFRKNISVNKTVSVQGGSLKMMVDQTLSRGHICTVGQTPVVVTPLSETVTTVQSIGVHSKLQKNSPVTCEMSNLTGSFLKSGNQRTEAFSERTRRESMTNSQSNLVEDKGHAEDRDLQSSSIISTQICLDKGAVVKDCKPETKTVQQITMLVPVRHPVRRATAQAKQETTEVLQAYKTGTNIQTEITKTILCTATEVKQESHFQTTTELSIQTPAEVQTVVSAQINCIEGSTQAKNQDCVQVVTSASEIHAEAIGDVEEVAVTASCVTGSHVVKSEKAQGIVSGDLTDNKVIEGQDKKVENKVEGAFPVLKLDQSSALPCASNSEQNIVMENADTGSRLASASSDDKCKSKTAQAFTSLAPDMQPFRSDAVQAKPETFTSKQAATGAALQANKIERIIRTESTKTIVCAEPEVTQVPQVPEVQKQTEMVSAQINCTEVSIQSKNQAQDCEQLVPLSFETPAETIRDAGEGPVRVSRVSETRILRSDDAQGLASDDLTLIDDKDIKRQDEEEVESLEVTLPVLMLEQSLALSHTSNREQNKVMEDANTGSSTGSASSNTPDSNNSLESKTVQGIISLVPSPPQVQLGPFCIQNTTIIELSTQSSAEVKTDTVISEQISCTEGIIQAKNQDCAQAVPSSLDTQAGVVGHAAEVAVTTSCVSGPDSLRSEDVPGGFTLINDKDIERQEKKSEEEVEGTLPVLGLDKNVALSDESNRAQNEVVKVSGTEYGITTASSDIPEISGTLCLSKTTTTDSLNTVELEVDEGKSFNSFHDTNKVKIDPTELDDEMVDPSHQQAESKKSTFLTDPGVAVKSSKTVELPSPREVSVSQKKPSPVETEVLMRMTEQAFHSVDIEEHVRSPDSLLSPNDSSTCFITIEANESLIPNDGEDEEVCLSLTEANSHMRPVEKYILSTKEEDQTLSFSRGQAFPEEDRNRNSRSSSTVNGTNNSKPTSQEIGGLWGKEVAGLSHRTMIADKDKQLSFGSQYDETCGTADNKEVQNPDGSPPGRSGSENQKETSRMEGEVRGQKNGDCLVANMPSNSKEVTNTFVKSYSFVSVPANEATSSGVASNSGVMATCNSGKASDLASSCTIASSSCAAGSNAESSAATGVQERFRHGSGEWMVSGGSLGYSSMCICNTETRSGTWLPSQETGRLSSRGSGEWKVYGGSLGRKSSLDGSTSLTSQGKEESALLATTSAQTPQEKGRFGSSGSGDCIVYSGSLGHKSSLPRTKSEESPSAAILLARSPPETTTFGSLGSGEWRVYGGSTGRMSSWPGSSSLPDADREEIPSGSLGKGRFGSGGSGEWRVYGGSTGRLSRASSADKVSVSSNHNQVISPPCSYTGSGQKLSSAGSGGRVSSVSVARRSSSVGSGGRLSSSSRTHRTSTSGKFSSTGSGEWKPVYSSANAHRSSVGSTGRSSHQRAPSPGGRMAASMASNGWLNSSTTSRNCINSTGSGSKLSSTSDRINNQTGGRISSSAGSGRTNSMGGRLIISSDRPIRSTGSGAGSNKERISVCKMAALTISAAGRERSQDRQRQEQAAATSPLLQRWLNTSAGVKRAKSGKME